MLIAYPENKVPMELDTADNHVVSNEEKEDIFDSTEGLKEVPSEDDRSGDDGLNTHFAAHRHGAFKGLWNLKAGDKVTVTDGNSKPTHYVIKNMVLLDEDGISQDGTSYYDEVMGTHGGERITLQTCSPRVENYNCMYFADKL